LETNDRQASKKELSAEAKRITKLNNKKPSAEAKSL